MFLDKSKIVLDCFTTCVKAYQYFPVSDASEYIPEWWKNLPKTYKVDIQNTMKSEAATMKTCPGVMNFFNKGFIVPLFSELSFQIKEESGKGSFYYEFAAQDKNAYIDLHDNRQYFGAFGNNYLQAKITLPWLITEKTGVNFLLLEPTWNMENPNSYMVPPGTLDFKYQNNINVNIFMEIKDIRVDIPPGFPLAHVIPLSDKKIKIKTHLVDDNEYSKLLSSCQPFSWIGSHRKRKYLIDKKNKCPFRLK